MKDLCPIDAILDVKVTRSWWYGNFIAVTMILWNLKRFKHLKYKTSSSAVEAELVARFKLF